MTLLIWALTFSVGMWFGYDLGKNREHKQMLRDIWKRNATFRKGELYE